MTKPSHAIVPLPEVASGKFTIGQIIGNAPSVRDWLIYDDCFVFFFFEEYFRFRMRVIVCICFGEIYCGSLVVNYCRVSIYLWIVKLWITYGSCILWGDWQVCKVILWKPSNANFMSQHENFYYISASVPEKLS